LVKLTLQTEFLWKLKLFISDPEETSQTIIKQSDDPETMSFPSLEYRTQFTLLECFLRVFYEFYYFKFHNLIEVSALEDTIYLLSYENYTQ
jgi:hypothetical protein